MNTHKKKSATADRPTVLVVNGRRRRPSRRLHRSHFHRLWEGDWMLEAIASCPICRVMMIKEESPIDHMGKDESRVETDILLGCRAGGVVLVISSDEATL